VIRDGEDAEGRRKKLKATGCGEIAAMGSRKRVPAALNAEPEGSLARDRSVPMKTGRVWVHSSPIAHSPVPSLKMAAACARRSTHSY